MKNDKNEPSGDNHSSLASAEDIVQKALVFARDTARGEIESIERLHHRALLALGVVLALLAIGGSILSFIGFQNLKAAAVQTATDVVKQRLADELTQKQIDIAVQQAVREHATAQITRAVQDQVAIAITKQLENQAPELRARTEAMTAQEVASLRPQIEAFAKQQASELIAKANEPRKLNAAQRAALSSYARKVGPLTVTLGVGGDPEAQVYESQIAAALEEGGWEVQQQALLGTHPDFPHYGLVVATIPEYKGSRAVRELMNCLEIANLNHQLFVTSNPGEWNGTTLLVLPKER